MQCRKCWGIHPKMTRLHPFTWLHLECANQGWYYIMYQSRQALLLQTFVTCQEERWQRWQRWYPNSTAGPQLSKAMVQQFIGALVALPKLKTNVTGKEPLSPSWIGCFTSWNGWITPLNLSLCMLYAQGLQHRQCQKTSMGRVGSVWKGFRMLSSIVQLFFWQEAKVGASGGCSWCHCSASATCQIW